MIAEILATGDEVRSGATVDSNSAYIARALEALGITVSRHTCVGDDLDALAGLFSEAGARADIVVVTGGLGPTEDDLTAQAAARAAGTGLVLDHDALTAMEAFFKSRGRLPSPSNRKQAMLPEGAGCLLNPVGTAPGFELVIGGGRFFFLPGVPFEMHRMLKELVLPRLEQLMGGETEFHQIRILGTFGLPESVVGEKLKGFGTDNPGVRLGLRARFPEIQVRLYGRGKTREAAARHLEGAAEWVASRLGRYVFSPSGESMEAVVGELLRQQGKTLAVAESCTGGLISHWITNVPGSSDYFLLSAVSYANAAKTGLLGVTPESLAEHGAVSEATVRQMAAGIQKLAGADYGLATSGIAGPGGGTPEKPVGTLCVGLAGPGGVLSRRMTLQFGDRLRQKTLFAMVSLEMLRRELLGIEQPTD